MSPSPRRGANAAGPGARRPAEPSTPGPLRQLRVSDLRGVARLATQATTGISRVAEGVHQSVLGTLGLHGGAQPGQARGLTGLVYQSIRGVTWLVDAGLQAGLARLEPFFEPAVPHTGVQWEREAVLAALNGVMGDRLQRDGNPLCTRMGFHREGLPLDLPALAASGAATGKVLVLVHGLCMNDLQWRHGGHDHGAYLAQALGCTPVYLRYNTGLHTCANGAELAAQLESLVRDWPVPVTEVAVLAHSMGGLVARSACHQAVAQGLGWPALLRHLVCLGTPHHGAPLEKAGHWVDILLGSTPYSRPFARLAQLRSAGITDLRHGHVLESDGQGRDRFHRQPDRRVPVPLPEGVACHAVAATLAARRSPVAERLVGDGLVPLHSALGIHDDARRTLGFAKDRQAVFHRMGHLALLGDAGVARQLEQWLRPA
ncbi:triacylglycerol lipase [Acidovorax sp. sif1233]|uniref:esterase/lipase family protein n=1 Tax=Acidovorax sp. sif1233 TaxID=2854792 RepID=UPI0021047D5C|nr:GPI inositol-deacylase [Acidovorax sp. sif1233]